MDAQRREACALVDEIRVAGGGATPEDIQFMKDNRPSLLKSFMNLQKQLGGSAKILSEQLNSKDTHFIYELIQNAEDNKYATGTEPSLAFKLKNDCLIIDSNEVGFTQRNIEAISQVGQSTKTRKTGYIGEKGIGFKSVFRVSRKVHIQSEPYSFAFIYEKGDSGLGMVTPLNEPYLTVPPGIQTRMILHFGDDKVLPLIKKELRDLPNTLLLFLKKLKHLSVNIELRDDDDWSVAYSIKQTPGFTSKERITVAKTENHITSEYDFWVKKRTIHDMPDHAARTEIDHAEIIVAFPLDRKNNPIIANQWISAYLPMRKEDFKFLIQSDFITGANREDVLDCTWNSYLLQAVAQTFVSAVEDSGGFLQHPNLRFSWVRYIPADRIAHHFWGRLQRTIIEILRTKRLFFSCRQDKSIFSYSNSVGGDHWTAQQLRIVPQQYRDGKNAPLLPDLQRGATAYISENYNALLDLPVLRKLGTADLALLPDFLNRLTEDLTLGRDSRWKSTSFTDPWFTKISNLILSHVRVAEVKQTLQKLELVPLYGGKWVASRNASIFFPTCYGVDIPKELKLSILDDKALNNPDFKNLLGKLGVAECEPRQVIPLIEQRYRAGRTVHLNMAVEDIIFLFWHHNQIPEANYKIFVFYDSGGAGYSVKNVADGGWLYDPMTDHPYSLHKLLGGKIPSELTDHVGYLADAYFDALEKCTPRHGKSGLEWLRKLADIKDVPQIRLRSQQGLLFGRQVLRISPEVKYIAENMPHYLLGVLQSNWIQYIGVDEWDKYIKETEVPILDSPKERALKTTFLPLPNLQKIVKDLGLSNRFGFLEELDGMTDLDSVKWGFLERFGVGVTDNLPFWLTLLHRAKGTQNVERTTVFKIYARLQTFIEKDEVDVIQHAFEKEDLIYVPPRDDSGIWQWISRKVAVWDGPEWFSIRQPLKNLAEYQNLFGLFVNTIQMLDVTISDCLGYLNHIARQALDPSIHLEEFKKINLLYSTIEELLLKDKDIEETREAIRTRFEIEKLIWDPLSKTWYCSSACVWADGHIILTGKVSVAGTYKNHLSFFRDVLCIRKPSIEMHIASLLDKASTTPEKTVILQEMRNINALDPKPDTLRVKLLDCSCFPVRTPSGDVLWESYRATFAIVDRNVYGAMFRDMIRTLDFTLEEVHSINTFLNALRLDKRMLSQCIMEKTQVEGSLPNSALTQDLRSKAYAITRYATQLGALNPLGIFTQLQELEVFTSDNMSRTLSIKQHNKTIAVPTSIAFFHLDASDGPLKLYVPQEYERKQVCLARHLPLKLLQHFGASVRDRGGVELGSIITAPSLFVVDAILEQDGVINIDGVCKPSTTENESAMPVADIEHETTVVTSSMRVANHQPRLHQIWYNDHLDESSWPDQVSEHAPDRESTDHAERPNLFKQLISFAIAQAEFIEGLPMKGSHALATQRSNVMFDHGLAVDMDIEGRANRKIGVIGELFVFTLLKQLSLPGFDRQCWKSTIRHLISLHEGYSDLGRWSGTETSDIVYFDTQSTLTNLLIRQGYLAENVWARRTPTYYIEVKTTMGDLDRPFFCSQSQFDRMEMMELPEDGSNANDIYIIARVFGVGQSRMGLKLYLDPWKMRRKRELRFEAQVYSITAC